MRFKKCSHDTDKNILTIMISPSQCGVGHWTGQSVGLGIERSRVRNSLVPSGISLRQGN